jgi:hypothetical protein
MSRLQHLFRRGSRYYWRRRVPLTLRIAFGRPQLVFGLRTESRLIARQLVRRLDVFADVLFHSLMISGTRLSPNDLAILVSDAVTMELEQFELRRAEYDLSPERSAVLAQISVGYAASCKDGLMSNDFESIEALMHEVIHQRGIRIDPDTPAWREFGRAMLRGLSQGYIRDAMRCLGEYEEDAQGSMPLPAVWQAFGVPATADAFARTPTGAQMTATGRASPVWPVAAAVSALEENAPTLQSFVEPWFKEKAKS